MRVQSRCVSVRQVEERRKPNGLYPSTRGGGSTGQAEKERESPSLSSVYLFRSPQQRRPF